MAEQRPMSLVPRNLLSANQTSPQYSSASNSLGNHELDQSSVSSSVRQHILKSRDKMTLYLRAPSNWCGVVNLQALRAPGNWSEVMTFTSEAQGLEFHNVEISDHRYLERVFKNLRQKLDLAKEAPVLDLKTNILISGLFMSTTMKAAVHLGPN